MGNGLGCGDGTPGLGGPEATCCHPAPARKRGLKVLEGRGGGGGDAATYGDEEVVGHGLRSSPKALPKAGGADEVLVSVNPGAGWDSDAGGSSSFGSAELRAAAAAGGLPPEALGDLPGKQRGHGGALARGLHRWRRPIAMLVVMTVTLVVSAYITGWVEGTGKPSGMSVANYGTIPVVAAVIGWGTNVAAIWMMFYPIEFVGCLPWARIGCGLDMPLFGWQGVIPMKVREMAEISVDLMTAKLIKVDEIFSRLEPERVAEEVSDVLPEIISAIVSKAGRQHCPRLWEYLPGSVRAQIEDKVVQQAPAMLADFVQDLQRNIAECFDLKHCVVERMIANPNTLNEMFLTCGEEEFEFIRISGFYLGFFFGLFQMLLWVALPLWWTLPVAGVFVGWATNVVALKVIFLPIKPQQVLCWTVQGLFLMRQKEVSALYAKMVSEKVLHASVLMDALVTGPSAENMFRLVDKHVSKCMEEQAASYKGVFLMSIGADTWAEFRKGVCDEFRGKLPGLLSRIVAYTQETLQLEETIRTRLSNLPPEDFERLLHAVFEQDEIKLILVGAILGALVGFLQAVIQTPGQLGLA